MVESGRLCGRPEQSAVVENPSCCTQSPAVGLDFPGTGALGWCTASHGDCDFLLRLAPSTQGAGQLAGQVRGHLDC